MGINRSGLHGENTCGRTYDQVRLRILDRGSRRTAANRTCRQGTPDEEELKVWCQNQSRKSASQRGQGLAGGRWKINLLDDRAAVVLFRGKSETCLWVFWRSENTTAAQLEGGGEMEKEFFVWIAKDRDEDGDCNTFASQPHWRDDLQMWTGLLLDGLDVEGIERGECRKFKLVEVTE